MSAEELHDLIRQLRVELEWAVRTGIQPPPAPPPPPLVATEPATAATEASPPVVHEAEFPSDAQQARRADEPPPHGDRRRPDEPPPYGDRRRPDEPPSHDQRRRAAGPPSGGDRPPYVDERPPPRRGGGDGPLEAPGSMPENRGPPPPRRSAHPHRPWEAYLPGDRPAPALSTDVGIEPDLDARLEAAESLGVVREILGPCVRCKLHRLGRKKIVFGVGPATADVMFVGEGPGGDEDRIGEPFVGAAGQLLTRIIEAGMGMKRADVYIANIVKCRPPRNRNPEPDEVEACERFLKAQIRVIRPKVLVALGKYAAQTLLRDTTPITRLRGRWREYEGIALMPTFHPAYLLRNPAEKRPVWEDIQEVLKFLGRPVPGRG